MNAHLRWSAQPLVAALLLTLPACLPAALPGMLVLGIMQASSTPAPTPEGAPAVGQAIPPGYDWSGTVYVTRGGEVLRLRHHTYDNGLYTDRSGRRASAEAWGLVARTSLARRRAPDASLRGCLALVGGTGDRAAYWYAVRDSTRSGRWQLAVYRRADNRCLGYVGRRGWRVDPVPEDERFGLVVEPRIAADQRLVLWDDAGLWQLDLRHRTLTLLQAATGLLAAELSPGFWLGARPGDEGEPTAVLLFSDRVELRRAAETLRFVLPAALTDRYFAVAPLARGQLALVFDERDEAWGIDPAGHILWRRHAAGAAQRDDDGQLEVVLVALLAPSVALWPALTRLLWLLDPSNQGPELSGILANWPVLGGLLLLALPFIAAVVRRQRRYGLSGTPGWVLYVLLLGPAGYVGYRTHRAWPLVVACSGCRRRTPVQRGCCARCGAPFPPPEPAGAELVA